MTATLGAKADLLYGDTGVTKTSRLGDAAEYFHKRLGGKARLVSADPGGWEPIQSLIDDGIIEAFALVPSRTNLIETMSKLSMGWWPSDVSNPQSPLSPPAWVGINSLLLEGLTSWCGLMMQEHEASVTWNDRAGVMTATNVRVPEMPKDSYIKSGDYLRRFVGRSDYGGVQGRIAEFVRNTGMLPVRAIWTALEAKGEDESKKPTYGPDFIGQALTGKCGPWFGNLIHLDFMAVEVEVDNPVQKGSKLKVLKPKPFMFLRTHIDPADPFKLPYPAKVRAPRTLWEQVPDFMEPRLDKLYELLEQLQQKELSARAATAPTTSTQL